MQWLKSSYRFEERRAIIVISTRDARELLPALQWMDTPDAIEDTFRQLILNTYPTLEGVLLHHIEFDYSLNAWRIGCSHPSFQPVREGEIAPTYGLIHVRSPQPLTFLGRPLDAHSPHHH